MPSALYEQLILHRKKLPGRCNTPPRIKSTSTISPPKSKFQHNSSSTTCLLSLLKQQQYYCGELRHVVNPNEPNSELFRIRI
jgi:hypothetical protein